MSKSELRRLEIVAPEAIKQLREQIAREIEDYAEKNHPKHKSNILWGLPRDSCQRCDITAAYRNAAAIARGEK